MTAWCNSHSPSGQIVGTVSDTAVKLKYDHNSVGHIIPIPGKNMAVTGSGAILSGANAVVKHHRMPLYPDSTGTFYVGGTNSSVSIFVTSGHQLIGKKNIAIVTDRWGRGMSELFPLSHHKVLATLSVGKDSIEFFEFDPIGDLESSDIDHLLVMSTPDPTVGAASTFEYQPEVKTSAKDWTLELLDGPEGAKIVDSKKLVWTAPDEIGRTEEFLLRVNGSNDDEVFHEFKLEIVEASKAEPEDE